MKSHVLKCWPEPFEAAELGMKRHEVRTADRDFVEGDLVVLAEWDPKDGPSGGLTGRSLVFRIGSITKGPAWGLPPDLCVFSLMPVHGVR